MAFKEELLDFNYREETIPIVDVFPRFNNADFRQRTRGGNYDHRHASPHRIILDLSADMWKGGYEYFLDEYGFYDAKYLKFSGHCHQMSPIMAVALTQLGFENVSYLECFRVDPETGEKVDPKEEQSEMRDEFCDINRIPYCGVSVDIDGQSFFFSPKHVKPVGHTAMSLLAPACHREKVGVLPHQLDRTKSGIYLAQVIDKPWVENGSPFVWTKQKVNVTTGQPLEPAELFCGYYKIHPSFG